MSEATAVMTAAHEPYAVTQAAAQQPVQLDNQQQMRVNYATDGGPYNTSPVPFPLVSTNPTNTTMNLNSGDQKRKRGRPRKYAMDGNMSVPAPAQHQHSFSASPAVAQPPPPPSMGGSGSSGMKKRGRPRGSMNKKKQMQVFGSTGIGFIPHVINVHAGEDVSSKIMAFSQNGQRTVCILSANGAISNVTLRAATSGGTATYEGRFDLLSLSGSFMLSEFGGQKSRTGGLSVTLAGPDGRVFGGSVAGLLIAASPVQVIVGSFLADGLKEPKSVNYMEPLSGPSKMINMAIGASSSPSRGTLSESSGGPASPLNLSSGACNNNHPQVMSAMPWK